MKVLFICMSNLDRSPCAAEILKTIPGFEAKSAGVGPFAEIQVNSVGIQWADVIICMESLHRDILCKKFPETYDKDVRIWNISTEYCRNDPELKKILKEKISGEFGKK